MSKSSLRPLLRPFLRQPGTWAMSVLLLAVGLGATVAVVSILDKVLLQPLPVKGLARIMDLAVQTPEGSGPLSYPAFCAERDQNAAFERLGWAEGKKFTVRLGQEPGRLLAGALISEGYLETLGLRPLLGRGCSRSEEEQPSSVVIIGESLWRRRFQGDPQVLGRLIYLNGLPCTVIGVGPRGFTGLNPGAQEEVWVPLASAEALGGLTREERLAQTFSKPGYSLGRLKAGLSAADAAAAAQVVGQRYLAGVAPQDREFQGQHTVEPLGLDRQRLLAAQLPRPWLLMGASSCLLLLGCANIANLRLAECLTRRRDYALKLAVGADPATLFRGVLAEGLVLVVPSCILGVLLAQPILAMLLRIESASFYASPMEVPLSLTTLVLAMLLAVAAALLSGLPAGWQATRLNATAILKNGGGTTRRHGLQGVLVALQLSLSLVLVAGSFGTARALSRLSKVNPGFRSSNLICLRIDLGAFRADPMRLERVAESIRQRALAWPGVLEAACAAAPPLEPEVVMMTRYRGAQGTVALQGATVGAGYFHALGIPLLEGHDFSVPPAEGGEAVVNEALAKRLWPGEGVEGKRYGPWPVRGLVKDFAMFPGKGLHEPVVFLRKQGWFRLPFLTLLVRTSVRPDSLLAAMRALPPTVDLDAVVVRADTLDQHLAALQRPLIMALWLFGCCGVASLVIAGVGLAGLLNQRVHQFQRELGLRAALGATSWALLAWVTQRCGRWVAFGLCGGLFGTWALQRLASAWADPIPFAEPITLLASSVVLLGVAAGAALVPALKVVRVDPAVALRVE